MSLVPPALPLLLALLLVPSARAGVAFEMEIEDARGDVVTPEGARANYTSADILSLRSHVVGDRIVQRVELAARPVAPDDSILLRNWFHDSQNGSFFVVDLEVRGGEPDPARRFLPLTRIGDFTNATYVDDAHYGLDNATWVFDFNASLVADATCFDPGAFTTHAPALRTRLPTAGDEAYLQGERRCRTASEPPDPVPPPIVFNPPARQEAPPGSKAPAPAPPVALVLLGAALLSCLRARRAP